MNLKEILLTEEQGSIVKFFAEMLHSKSLWSIAIKAFAGCGKSFILKYLAYSHPDIKFLGLAFNNDIVASNKKEFPKRNCKWFTVHTFAKTYLLKAGVNFDFSNQRGSYKALELIKILDIKDAGDYKLAGSIAEVFKVFCQSALKEITPELIRKAAKAQKNRSVIDMNDAYLLAGCKYSAKLWNKLENGEISPTFDFYLKYFEINGFAKNIDEFDVVELDEAQDSNAVTMSIIFQIKGVKAFVAVGDDNQSIYGFRGTVNALDHAEKSFFISNTFRYVPKIANYANNILEIYKNVKVPIKSLAKNNGPIDGVTAYLSRNNSTIIGLIKDFVKEGVFFKTAKDPEKFFELALTLLEFRLEGKLTNRKFFYLKDFSDFEEVEEYIAETEDNELATAYKMQKQYGKSLYILLKKAKYNYKSKEKSKIVLTTAHTSKGLEWDNVKILNDFPDLVKLLKDAKIKNSVELMRLAKGGDLKAAEIIQEINLYYVAVTRARFSVTRSGTKEEG